jgi:hypothetical protein
VFAIKGKYMLRPDDSESTLTENSDGTAHDISILSGDAHPEDIRGEEMESLIRGLGTGFGFSCGISCSLINPTGKRKFL